MTLRKSAVAAAAAFLSLHCGPAAPGEGASLPDSTIGGADATENETTASAAATVVVRGFVASGTGCPAGTAQALITEQNGAPALNVPFSSFFAQGQLAASGRARGETKSCQLAFTLDPLAGQQIGLSSIRTRGAIDVFGRQDTTRGINNAVKITRGYFFNSASNNSGVNFPTLDTYLVNSSSAYTIEERTVGNVIYAGCNERVIARASLGINTTGANNYGDISAFDQNGGLQFNLVTRPCTGASPPGSIVTIPANDARAVVKNACVLRGVGTTSQREVCYGPNGEVVPAGHVQ